MFYFPGQLCFFQMMYRPLGVLLSQMAWKIVQIAIINGKHSLIVMFTTSGSMAAPVNWTTQSTVLAYCHAKLQLIIIPSSKHLDSKWRVNVILFLSEHRAYTVTSPKNALELENVFKPHVCTTSVSLSNSKNPYLLQGYSSVLDL